MPKLNDNSYIGKVWGNYTIIGFDPNIYNNVLIKCNTCGEIRSVVRPHKYGFENNPKVFCQHCKDNASIKELKNKHFDNIEIIDIQQAFPIGDSDVIIKCKKCGKILTKKYRNVSTYKQHTTPCTCKAVLEMHLEHRIKGALVSKNDNKHNKYNLPRNIGFNKQEGTFITNLKIHNKRFIFRSSSLKKIMHKVAELKIKNNIWNQEEAESYLNDYDKYKDVKLFTNKELNKKFNKKRIKHKLVSATKKLYEKRIIRYLKFLATENVYKIEINLLINYIYNKYTYNKDYNKFKLFLKTLIKNSEYIVRDCQNYKTISLKESNTKSSRLTLDGIEFKSQADLARHLKLSRQEIYNIVIKKGTTLFHDENNFIVSLEEFKKGINFETRIKRLLTNNKKVSIDVLFNKYKTFECNDKASENIKRFKANLRYLKKKDIIALDKDMVYLI